MHIPEKVDCYITAMQDLGPCKAFKDREQMVKVNGQACFRDGVPCARAGFIKTVWPSQEDVKNLYKDLLERFKEPIDDMYFFRQLFETKPAQPSYAYEQGVIAYNGGRNSTPPRGIDKDAAEDYRRGWSIAAAKDR